MNRPSRGFSLIETLIALAVLSLLLGLSLPSLRGLLLRSAVSSSHNLLLSGFASARQHAVFSRRPTTICPGSADAGCRSDAVWSQGWIIFVDHNGNALFDSADQLIRAENPLPKRTRAFSNSGRPRAVFQPNGTSSGHNLTLRLCGADTPRPLSAIVLSNTGRARAAGPNELAALPACD